MSSPRFDRTWLGLAAAAALVAGGCVDIMQAAQFVDREDKKFAVTGKPDVTLSTFDGSIEIRPTDRREVAVTIEKRGVNKEATDRIDVHAEQNGNQIAVEVRWPKGTMIGFAWHNSASAKLIVSMPAASDLHARTGDGSIDVERLTGAIELRSGDGSIHGRALSGDIKAQTGDGSIKLEDVNGSLDVNTGDGSVTIDGKLTAVRARSGDGSVAIQAAPGSAAEADWTITTGDGSVDLRLPEGFNAELDAHTGDGSIVLHDLTLSNVTGRVGRNTLRGRLGAGGRAVNVRTGDGTITLRR